MFAVFFVGFTNEELKKSFNTTRLLRNIVETTGGHCATITRSTYQYSF